MNLFEGLEEKINSTLPTAKKEIASIGEQLEIEIRLRSITGGEGAGIGNEDSFARALSYFIDYIHEPEREDYWSPDPPDSSAVEDVVKYYNSGDFRSIQKKDATTITYERKHPVFGEHSTIWPILFSVSGEKKNVSFTQGDILTAKDVSRNRIRRSFIYSNRDDRLPMLQVDFTWTNFTNASGVKKREFEIEIEVSKDVDFEEFEKVEGGYKYTALHTAINDIYITLFKYAYNTPLVYSVPMYRSVILSINRAINPNNSNETQLTSDFVNKPRTLGWYDFERTTPFCLFPLEGVTEPAFAVTIKSDGTRAFVYYHTSGIYLFNPLGGSMVRISSSSPHELEGSMLDAELLSPPSDITEGPELLSKRKYDVWAFDCLFVNQVGKDKDREIVKDYRQRPLMERLQAMRYVCRTHNEYMSKDVEAPIQLQLTPKKFLPFHDRMSFYDANRLAFVQNIVNGVEKFKSDGLIYTDMGPYMRMNLRPACVCDRSEKQSCEKCRDFNRSVNRKFKPVELLTTDFLIKEDDAEEMELHAKTRENTVPFRGTKEKRVLSTQFRREFYDGNSLQVVEPENIYEFQWNKVENIWVPLRKRTDRIEPNSMSVAMDNWSAIHKDIPKGVLVGKLKGKKVLSLMRAYQNQVKSITLAHGSERILFNLKQTDETRRPRLFDIGSGYGGDVKKWRATDFEVYALEPDPVRLDELEQRARDADILNRVQTLQLKAQDYAMLQRQMGVTIKPVDMVTSFHSMTLVYDKAESVAAFIKSVKTVLKIGGIFSCMAMDGAAIHNYLGSYKQLTMNGIKIQRAKNDPRQILVKMVTSDASLARGQIEYLVDFDHLISSMEAEGFELTLDNYLDTAALLTDSELWWCQMTRLIEMRYVGAKELPKTKEKLHMLTNILSGTMRSAQVEVDQIIEVKSRQLKCFDPKEGDKFWLVGVLAGGSSFFHALLWCSDIKYRKSKGDVNFRFDRVLQLRLELASLMKISDIPSNIVRDSGTFSLESCKETMAEYTTGCGSFMVPFVERVLNINVHVLSWLNDELIPVRDMKLTLKPDANNVVLHCDSTGRFEPIGRSLAGQEQLAAFVFSTGDSLIQALLNFKTSM